jgi:hypothetical protein
MPLLLERLLQQARPDSSQGPYVGILLALVVSMVAALLVRLLYRLFYEGSDTGSQIDRSFLLISPAITTLFITIQFSLPLSLGLLGALSIVRFRVPIREPEEIGFLMVVVALLLQHYLGERMPGLGRSGGLLMLTVADAVYARNAAAIEGVLSSHLAWIRLEHLNGREGATTLNYTFRARGRTDWNMIRHELEALGPLDALSVLRAPQGGM